MVPELLYERQTLSCLSCLQDCRDVTIKSPVLLGSTRTVTYCEDLECSIRPIQTPDLFVTQTLLSGPRGSTWITPVAVETTSSWTPFAFTTVPGCVRTPGPSKQEPLNGCQYEKQEKRSMQTPLWASGASTRSRGPVETAPITRSVSSAPKVWCWNAFKTPSSCSESGGIYDCYREPVSLKQMMVSTFREPGVCGQNGAHVQHSVARSGSKLAPEPASHAPHLALGQWWKEKNATDQSAPKQVDFIQSAPRMEEQYLDITLLPRLLPAVCDGTRQRRMRRVHVRRTHPTGFCARRRGSHRRRNCHPSVRETPHTYRPQRPFQNPWYLPRWQHHPDLHPEGSLPPERRYAPQQRPGLSPQCPAETDGYGNRLE